MAVTASTATFTIFVLVFMLIIATVFAVVTATSASVFTVDGIQEILNFFFCSLAIFQDVALKVQCLACQRMVQVNLYLVISNVKHMTHEMVSILILQWHHSILENIFVVEMTVDAEYFLFQIEHTLVYIFSISLFGSQREVKFSVFFHVLNSIFKVFERNTETADKHERLVSWCLFH